MLLVLVGMLTVLLDAGTKVLVVEELEGQRSIELPGGIATLVVSRNSGAAFSFAQGRDRRCSRPSRWASSS